MTTSIVSVSATQSALQVNGVNALVFNAAGDVQIVSQNGGQLAGMRNVIINGDMRIDQRSAGAAGAINNAGNVFAIDRFNCAAMGGAGTGTASIQRVLDGPPGLPYSLKYTVTNAKVPAATDSFYIYQPVEADNCGTFAFGTTGARSATLSFWVKSSIVGTHGGFLRNSTAAGTQRSYVINYTVNTANTWEYKTIVVPADSQVIATGNGQGLAIVFDLGSGSSSNGVANTWQAGGGVWRSANCVNLISTLNATFQVTGVQLEAGPMATPFEHRPVGLELALCQRYFFRVSETVQTIAGGTPAGMTANGGSLLVSCYFAVPMRGAPTFTNPFTDANFANATGSPPAGQWTLQAVGQSVTTKTGTLVCSVAQLTPKVMHLYIASCTFSVNPNWLIPGPGISLDFAAEL